MASERIGVVHSSRPIKGVARGPAREVIRIFLRYNLGTIKNPVIQPGLKRAPALYAGASILMLYIVFFFSFFILLMASYVIYMFFK